MKRKRASTSGNILWIPFVVLLVAAALRDQLRLPPAERTWHGRIADRIPYDFRPPTAERIRATLWNKNSAELLVPTVFGIGWTINLYPLLHTEPPQELE